MISAGPYREELYGAKDLVIYRCRAAVVTVSLIYAAVAACSLIYAMQKGELSTYAAAGMMLIFCLWRINKMHRPICLMCRKAMLLYVPQGNILKGPALYIPVEYRSIVGFSDNWRELYIGTASPGNMVSMPVALALVSAEDKGRIKKYIEDRQREPD